MEATVFTPMQQELLRLFQHIKNEEELAEIKQLLMRYYAKKLDDHLEKLWDLGVLNQERLDEINEMDLHKLK